MSVEPSPVLQAVEPNKPTQRHPLRYLEKPLIGIFFTFALALMAAKLPASNSNTSTVANNQNATPEAVVILRF